MEVPTDMKFPQLFAQYNRNQPKEASTYSNKRSIVLNDVYVAIYNSPLKMRPSSVKYLLITFIPTREPQLSLWLQFKVQ